MKKRIFSMTLAFAMTVGLLAGCSSGGNGGSSGSGKSASWKVTCPWAPSGVAAMVSQKAAAKSTQYSDKITLVAEAIAGDAAQAVAKGETQFAVSHQSQILETYQQGGVNIVCAFDEKAIENGPFAGVEGVGEKGYPYFRNRCFIMARAGTDEATVAELKDLYDKILADEEVVTWLQDTMLLEVDTMSQDDVNAHVENVKSIVNEYKDLVAG